MYLTRLICSCPPLNALHSSSCKYYYTLKSLECKTILIGCVYCTSTISQAIIPVVDITCGNCTHALPLLSLWPPITILAGYDDLYTYMHTCILYMYTCTYTCILYMYTCTYTCILYMYECTYMYMYVCTCMYLHVYIYVCIMVSVLHIESEEVIC